MEDKKKNSQYHSIRDISEILDVSYKYVYDTIASGELPYTKFSQKLIRVKKTDFDSWLKSKEVA